MGLLVVVVMILFHCRLEVYSLDCQNSVEGGHRLRRTDGKLIPDNSAC